jgi:hypothetical protein
MKPTPSKAKPRIRLRRRRHVTRHQTTPHRCLLGSASGHHVQPVAAPAIPASASFSSAVDQLVEITALLTLVNLDRFNAAFGIGSAGYSEGMVCLVPDRPPNIAAER